VAAVGDTSHGLSQRQGRALGVGEAGHLAPTTDGEEAGELFSGVALLGVQAQAESAAVDQASANMHQVERALRHAALERRAPHLLRRFHRSGNDRRRVLHAWLHLVSFDLVYFDVLSLTSIPESLGTRRCAPLPIKALVTAASR